MMRQPLTLGLLFILGLTTLTTLSAESYSLIERDSEDGVFLVVGASYDGVQTVGQLSDQMVRLGKRLLPVPERPPQPVLVRLIPETHTEFTQPYLVRQQPNGSIYVLIRWGPNTRFQDCCRALASGLLQRTALWHYGPSGPARIPAWFELGMGEMLAATVRPAIVDTYRNQILRDGPMPLASILDSPPPLAPDAAQAALNAYWFLRYLENQSPNLAAYRRLCSAFLAGMEPIPVLIKAFPGQFSNMQELELWWEVGFQATARSRQPPFHDLASSREIIRRMAFVVFEDDGQDLRVGGEELRQHRDNPALHEAIEQRVREIKVEIQKINPAYYNAMLSLGLFLKAAIEEEDEAYAKAAARFTADFAAAQNLELEIRRLLRW